MLAAARPHRAGIVLGLGILGMLGWVIFLPVSIAAWVLGSRELEAMNSGLADPSGRTAAQVGHVFGIIGTALWAVALLTAR